MVAIDAFCCHAVVASWAVHRGTSTEDGHPVMSDAGPRRTFLRLFTRCRVMLAILFGLLALEIPRPIANHYDILGVSIHATAPEIDRSYRENVELHQQVELNNPSLREQARGSLKRLSLSHTVLMNETKRHFYSRLGDLSENEYGHLDDTFTIPVVLAAASFQCLSFAVAYMATLHPRFAQARQLFALFSIGVFCLELQLRILSWETPQSIPYFYNLLIFEQVELVKRITPAVLGIFMLLSASFFKDETGALLRLLHGVLLTNRVLSQHVEALTQQLDRGSLEADLPRQEENIPQVSRAVSGKTHSATQCSSEGHTAHPTSDSDKSPNDAGFPAATGVTEESELRSTTWDASLRQALMIGAILAVLWYTRFST